MFILGGRLELADGVWSGWRDNVFVLVVPPVMETVTGGTTLVAPIGEHVIEAHII